MSCLHILVWVLSNCSHGVAWIYGPQSAKTDLRVKIFKIGFFAQNSSLGLVDDTQSENIGEKWEYMP